MGYDEILCRYVVEYERKSILAKAHGGITRGHYAGRETTQKILCTGLWWLIVHRDSKIYCRACNVFQRTGRLL